MAEVANMSFRLIFLHTMPALTGLFNDLAREILPPGVEVWHIGDEVLLKVVLAKGEPSPFIYRRVAEHAVAAEEAGANAMQVTCSSISPCVEAARPLVGIPVFKIDEPMVDRALSLGSRIGVVATAGTTLKPTSELVRARAQALGKTAEVEAVLCEGAYPALMSGEMAAHDQIVLRYLKDMMGRCEVILLAQASMARVAAALPPEEQRVPVLASPRLAIEKLAEFIQAYHATEKRLLEQRS
jgi:Asp/Glu/hydantoin racemase